MTETPSTSSFFAELKRRKVVRVGIAYGAAAFVVLQIADLVFPALGVPDWCYRFLVIACLAGFPFALVLAWLYDLTPEGVRRTGARDPGPVVVRLGQVALYVAAAIGVVSVLFVAVCVPFVAVGVLFVFMVSPFSADSVRPPVSSGRSRPSPPRTRAAFRPVRRTASPEAPRTIAGPKCR